MEAHARHTDPETSHQAAASVKKMTMVQNRVWSLFGRVGGMTDSRLIEVWNKERLRFPDSFPRVSDSGLRTRRKELVERGHLKDSGLTVELPSGRKSIVWTRV